MSTGDPARGGGARVAVGDRPPCVGEGHARPAAARYDDLRGGGQPWGRGRSGGAGDGTSGPSLGPKNWKPAELPDARAGNTHVSIGV